MDYETARRRMVDHQIRTTDVTRHDLLRAFLSVPREKFVPEEHRPFAYLDEHLPIAPGRYMQAPATLAKLLQVARIMPNEVVLDVGVGTGYGGAIISELASSVIALEEDPALAESATKALARNGYVSCAVVEGPLIAGCASEAPFDVIVFEGAIEVLPELFLDQLKAGGRLVCVMGSGNAGEARLFIKDEKGIVSDRFAFNCATKPLPGFQKDVGFVF